MSQSYNLLLVLLVCSNFTLVKYLLLLISISLTEWYDSTHSPTAPRFIPSPETDIECDELMSNSDDAIDRGNDTMGDFDDE